MAKHAVLLLVSHERNEAVYALLIVLRPTTELVWVASIRCVKPGRATSFNNGYS